MVHKRLRLGIGLVFGLSLSHVLRYTKQLCFACYPNRSDTPYIDTIGSNSSITDIAKGKTQSGEYSPQHCSALVPWT